MLLSLLLLFALFLGLLLQGVLVDAGMNDGAGEHPVAARWGPHGHYVRVARRCGQRGLLSGYPLQNWIVLDPRIELFL